MPKPNRGKTKTIKKRAIYVYLPSQTMADEWKKRAKNAGTSISKFVIERVEESIRREEEEKNFRRRLEPIQPPVASPQQLSCPACGKSNIIEAYYCSSCGRKMRVR